MNYRDYKKFSENNYYHIYNRGNGKMDIFSDDEDRRFFLYTLKENLYPDLFVKPNAPKNRNGYVKRKLPLNSFNLICYCLMPNHFHLLIRQNSSLSVSKFMSRISTSYAKYFNKKHERVGSLFQDVFKSILVGTDTYLVWLSAYIHQNPVIAGMVKSPEDYEWSSYSDFIGNRKGTLCQKNIIIDQFINVSEYQNFVKNSTEKIKQRKDLKNLLLE